MRIIVATVILQNNKILVVQSGEKVNYGLWNYPNTYLEEGNSLVQTAVNLASNLTGINVKVSKLIKIQNFLNSRKEQNIRFVYLAEVINGTIKTNLPDIIEVKWMDINDIFQFPDDKLLDPIRLKSILYFVKEQKFYPLDLIKDI